MISVSNVTMRYGAKVLFEEVSTVFPPGKRYGLTGPNGAGKSTFMKLLTGELEPQKGSVVRPRKFGVISQDQFAFDAYRVIDTVIMGNRRLWAALEERDAIYAKADMTNEDGMKLGELEGIVGEEDGYTAETDAALLLQGLDIPDELHERRMAELQGGQKVRVLLAQALFGNPAALLLDEPTNHLDLDSIHWLQDFLNKYEGVLIVISHDRHFLNSVCTHIADIDYETIITYTGTYDEMVLQKTQVRSQIEAQNAQREKKIAQLNEFIARFAAGTRSSQVQSRRKEVERLQLTELAKSNIQRPYIRFDQKRPSGKHILEVENIVKAYADNEVLRGFTSSLVRGEKVAIIGRNGAGKTTLLNALLANSPTTPMSELRASSGYDGSFIDGGKVVWGHEAAVGYFPQDHSAMIEGGLTVLEWLHRWDPSASTEEIRSLLGQMLFPREDANKKTDVLSGGEAARLEVGDMNAVQLAKAVKDTGRHVPIVVLAYDYGEVKDFRARNPVTEIERIFLWQGNVRILITMIKYIEDKRNVYHDTHVMGVPVMLVVEDNIRYYSSFLPVIYTELITQSRHLLSDSLNVAHRLMRMRARPKILLCTNYEDAADNVLRYRDYLMGVVSDVEFPRNGQLSPGAGFALAEMIREEIPDVPILLQSSRTEFQEPALAQGYQFLRKRSPTLLADLRKFFVEQVGFGDFIFRMPDGREVARARDLMGLETKLAEVDAESVAFHASRNHFSQWLRARTEFAVAQKLRPRKLSDFESYEHLRRDLIQSIADYRREQSELLIGDFHRGNFQATDATFLRMGSGSLGGKGRGLAFIRHLLHKFQLNVHYPDVRIVVPPSVILATDIFDQFIAENKLLDFAMSERSDEDIVERFRMAPLPDEVVEDLRVLLAQMRYPLAVRSSSLLEDSQYQPFAGVYDTFMLSNQHPSLDVRLAQLMEAIKRVYASVFNRHAKAYVQATSFRLEEEKMAVVIQRVVGTIHGQKFYPEFSGVVRSRNFYPATPMKPEDGIAAVGLGLGRTVVEGGKCVRFCPRYPKHMLQFSSVEEILANTQSNFWALPLDGSSASTQLREVQFPLKEAEQDGTLYMSGSTFCADNHAVYDGIGRTGARVVTFAPILKHGMFPLAPILEELSTIGEKALGRPVEIEFAVRLPRGEEDSAEFGVLQMRPLVLSRELEDVAINDTQTDQTICQSNRVLGNGRARDLHDVIVVDFHRFERARSQKVAQAVAYFNHLLLDRRTPYLLIGVGRWGSNDPGLASP